MKNKQLSDLEIKLYNATIKFLNKLREEKTNPLKANPLEYSVTLSKSIGNKTYIGIHHYVLPDLSLTLYENSGKTRVCFTPAISGTGSPEKDEYKEFILKEVPECKNI